MRTSTLTLNQTRVRPFVASAPRYQLDARPVFAPMAADAIAAAGWGKASHVAKTTAPRPLGHGASTG
jgi:hypothetical protein